MKDANDGHSVVGIAGGFLRGDGVVHRPLRVVGGTEPVMTPIVWAGVLVTVFVAGYLVYVLLHAERF